MQQGAKKIIERAREHLTFGGKARTSFEMNGKNVLTVVVQS